MKFKLQQNAEEVLADAVEAVTYARTLTDNIEFSAEDATRSEEYGAMIRTIISRVPNIDQAVISVHCHNDLGLGTANSLAAVENGARQVECTINGIGERAGNASLEELVMSFRTRHDQLEFETNIDTTQIYPASRLVSQVTGIRVQPNKAIVGANAFAHEAGIHQDGVLKEKSTYEIMTPESVGLPQNQLVMGKHSGRHAFREKIVGLGYELSDEQVEIAFQAFKALSDKKKTVYDEDIDALIADEIIRIPHYFKLLYINVNSGSVSVPNATIQLEINNETLQGAEFGDGPVDATFKAIKRLTKTGSKLLTYEVKSITGGTDALGEVTVRIEEDGLTVMGQGAHTDIIVATARAYINALNKLEYKKHNRPRVTV